MTWVLTGILTVVLVELFLRLPLIVTAVAIGATARRAMRTLQRRGASDHWKEKASQAYAVKMLRATCILAGCLALVAIVGTILTLGTERLLPGFGLALLSWAGLFISLVVATVYVMARARFVRR